MMVIGSIGLLWVTPLPHIASYYCKLEGTQVGCSSFTHPKSQGRWWVEWEMFPTGSMIYIWTLGSLRVALCEEIIEPLGDEGLLWKHITAGRLESIYVVTLAFRSLCFLIAAGSQLPFFWLPAATQSLPLWAPSLETWAQINFLP